MKKNFNTYIRSFALVLVCGFASAQPSIHPAKPQAESIRIDGATIHIGNGESIENASLSFEDGKITYVGDSANAPTAQKTIHASGKHIYPGFIAPNSNVGLVEFEAVKATVDFAEVGENNAHVRSIIAYNTDSKVINTLRLNGILQAQITPQRGLLSGQSSIVQFDAWNWEDAVVQEDDGLHINWPEMPRWRGSQARDKAKIEEANKNKILQLISLFEEAKAYAALDPKNKVVNARLQALEGIFEGEKQVFVHVNDAKNIQKAVLTFTDLGVTPILVGGREAHLVTDLLKQYDVPVLIHQAHSLPAKEHDDVYLTYKQANLLYEAGVLAAYGIFGSDGFWEQRNLPFMAGTAVAYGLPYEQAVAYVTLNTAKILGIDDRTGSIEVGKSADLFISTGDALDMRTNQLEKAFIQGRELDLSSWHTQLYDRYKERYESLDE